jgi:hypothetical protein
MVRHHVAIHQHTNKNKCLELKNIRCNFSLRQLSLVDKLNEAIFSFLDFNYIMSCQPNYLAETKKNIHSKDLPTL